MTAFWEFCNTGHELAVGGFGGNRPKYRSSGHKHNHYSGYVDNSPITAAGICHFFHV